MNPRVSRSSALASKATGFAIAKIAALLAIGYTLDEIPNDITQKTPASFEPSLDYVVVKIPRWTFEKFPRADPRLTIQMKSVGEAMAIGRTFAEALGKAVRSLEIGRDGLDDGHPSIPRDQLIAQLRVPTWERIFHLRRAFVAGMSIEEVARHTHIDPWFLDAVRQMVAAESALPGRRLADLPREELRDAKRLGLSDRAIARALGNGSELSVRSRRRELGIAPVYKTIDTCAAEFEAETPYFYSTYEEENESIRTAKPKVVILGGGPNRIGQGIEFDYCCVHACYALSEAGYETVMINCNPETVSTDYDTSDRLYFEPLTLEDVAAVLDNEKPDGVLVQFGGQTPLKLARPLEAAGYPIWGTSPERFRDDAFEYDVDALSDWTETWIGGIQQHIEEAGIHSGDSFSVLPAWKVTPAQAAEIKAATRRLAQALQVRGLVNIQFASQNGVFYVLEVNPRASRTVPFVSKAIGVPM